MATLRASTPPPPTYIRTPTTPRFGYQDDYQPYTPRKSTRVAKQARIAQTPPPQSYTPQHFTPRSSRKRDSAIGADNLSSPSSPQTATKKKAPRNLATMGGRRVSGALNQESTAFAANSLGLGLPKVEQHRSMAAISGMGMLPTPDKTPKRAPTEIAPHVKSIARSLFSNRTHVDNEVMPTPSRKRNKKYSAFTIGGDDGDEDSTPITIFTDSNDRVPEVDNSLKNPFYGPGSMATPEPVKRSSKRRKISIPGEEDITVEEAEKRQDGIVVVFRGKKVFKKFDDMEDNRSNNMDSEDDDTELDQSVPHNLRPRSRSMLKPRLLFGPAKVHTTEDEEADTEIEDGVATPSRQVTRKTATPKAPRFGPASPPTTSRATRSKDVNLNLICSPIPSEDESSQRSVRSANRSPFDLWSRSKASTVPTSKKRGGEDLMTRGEEKRLRR